VSLNVKLDRNYISFGWDRNYMK